MQRFRPLSPLTVALFGGLGNQMFQYAFARAQSLARSVPFRLDRRPLVTAGGRPYALDSFALRDAGEGLAMPPAPGRLQRRLGWSPFWMGARYAFQRGLSSAPPEVVLPAYFWGTWQGEKYFRPAADHLHADFALAEPFTAERAVLATRISATSAVAVHVRRGDYVFNAKANAYHGTLAPAWYARARRELESTTTDALTFFIFSDDPEWARANITCFGDAVFVEPSEDGKDAQDLHLIALCRHQIVANSSFSWWGAWLNRHPQRRVVAPRIWFRDARIDTSDLVPADWLRV